MPCSDVRRRHRLTHTHTHAHTRTRARLHPQLKKLLSSIPEAPINVESLTNDIDASGMMTREKFNELAAGVLDRVKAPLREARLHANIS